MNICVIPARGGSQRILQKNVKPFFGKPIIAYSIEAAKQSGLFDRIVVSTDDLAIKLIALHYGAEVWMRDPRFGADDVGTQDVVKECLKGMQIKYDSMVCCLYATAPLMSLYDLRHGFYVACGKSAYTYVMSVGYSPLQDAGQFYWGQQRAFVSGTPLINVETRMIHVDASRVCDINTPEDWVRAEQMFIELQDADKNRREEAARLIRMMRFDNAHH